MRLGSLLLTLRRRRGRRFILEFTALKKIAFLTHITTRQNHHNAKKGKIKIQVIFQTINTFETQCISFLIQY